MFIIVIIINIFHLFIHLFLHCIVLFFYIIIMYHPLHRYTYYDSA